MKRVEVTVPKGQSKNVKEVIENYTDDATTSEVQKGRKKFVRFQFSMDSEDIDEFTEEAKSLKELETGDLTIDIIEESARIEKGKRRRGGTTSLSVQEMYSKAFELSSFDMTSWALIALGSGIAVFGATTENVMVVIGAMVIAPLLGPLISVSFGLVIGDRKLIQDGLFYSVISLGVALVTATVVSLFLPASLNPLIRLIASPGFATVPLSLFVGSAAALTFSTDVRETLAGVAVAIALVPPVAVAGIALSLLNVSLFIDVGLVLLTNVMALILAGSLTFKLMGVAPSTYYRKKVSEEKLRRALAISVVSILVIGAGVGYISYQDYRNSSAETRVNDFLDANFGERILKQEVRVSGGSVRVELAVVDPQFSEEGLEERISSLVGMEANVSLVAVQSKQMP